MTTHRLLGTWGRFIGQTRANQPVAALRHRRHSHGGVTLVPLGKSREHLASAQRSARDSRLIILATCYCRHSLEPRDPNYRACSARVSLRTEAPRKDEWRCRSDLTERARADRLLDHGSSSCVPIWASPRSSDESGVAGSGSATPGAPPTSIRVDGTCDHHARAHSVVALPWSQEFSGLEHVRPTTDWRRRPTTRAQGGDV